LPIFRQKLVSKPVASSTIKVKRQPPESTVMPHPALALFLRHLRRTTPSAGAGDPSDGQLLERFAGQRDEAAFAALLERHGRMVWNVCRRVLANASDADDAFQAAFLVLVRKAGSIARRESVGSWLHGVAYRVALEARASAARRRTHERQGATMPTVEAANKGGWSEVRQILDEELARLPEKYRAPLVLCYLEGKTNDEAADLLGWTRGTIAGRLSRARDLLRHRLTRRGLGLTSAGLAVLLADNAASAPVPAALVPLTLKAALGYAAATGGPSASAVALAQGVLHTMFLTRLKITLAVLATFVIIAAGAGWFWQQAQATPANPDRPEPKTAAVAKPADVPKRLVLADDPAQAKADRPALVLGNTTFACDLYARLRQQEGNVVYSPYSISTALAMTYAGARGKTAEQMAQVLHFTLPQERLHPAAGALVRDLSGANQGKKQHYRLHIANALGGQKDHGFQGDFVTLTRDSYGAPLTEVDFLHAREEARKTINGWVAKQTQDKITELLKEKHLTDATRLVLTNAIYFKAEWETKFVRDYTKDRPFQVSAEKKVDVKMMAQTAKFAYLDGDSFQMVELPYKGKDLSMLVLLPKKTEGLADLEKLLTADNLAKWQGKVSETTLTLFLPKFKVTGDFGLKTELVAMGMELPFASGSADFSGMSREPLFLSDVVHKTFVDVDEEGTEAAGATAAVMSFGGPPPKAATFRADHPFVFLVRDNRSGSVLFVGRVVDPTKST
jgi:serpin B